MLKDDDIHKEQLMQVFMDYFVKSLELLSTFCKWNASFFQVHVQSYYLALSRVLYNVYRVTASTSSVEPNHKINKRVFNTMRFLLSYDRVEKQVSIMHNWSQLNRAHLLKQTAFDLRIARQRCSNGATTNAGNNDEQDLNEYGDGEIIWTALNDNL